MNIRFNSMNIQFNNFGKLENKKRHLYDKYK